MTSVLLSLVIALVGILGAALWFVLGRVNSRIDRVDTRLDGFDGRLRTIEERAIRMDEKLGRVEQQLGGLDDVVQHFTERLDTLIQNTAGIEKRLDG